MPDLVLLLCKLLDLILNPAIVVLAFVEAVLLIKTVLALRWCKSRTYELDHQSVDLAASRPVDALTISDHVVVSRLKNWDQFVTVKENYDRNMKLYDLFSAIIQIFPLLGILGTVAGLYLSLNVVEEGQRFSYEGIAFALSSTVLGLIFSIAFKVADALLTAPVAADVESRLELFETDFEIRRAESQERNGEKGKQIAPGSTAGAESPNGEKLP